MNRDQYQAKRALVYAGQSGADARPASEIVQQPKGQQAVERQLDEILKIERRKQIEDTVHRWAVPCRK